METLTQDTILKRLQDTVDDSVVSWDQVPHHSMMLNIDKAVSRFIFAIANNQKVLFVHDSDADGIGTYLLSRFFLPYLNYHNFELIITNRSQGYGFVPKHLDDRLNNLPHLIITADNGITAIDACNRAEELGVDVIITDHHQVDSVRGLPKAIVVDPHQEGCSFPYPEINGTFVFWYFLSAVQEVAQVPIDMRYEFLPELCLTTISDVMPLTGINRFIVREGLKVFNSHHHQWVKTFWTMHDKDNVTAENLAFGLIPSINCTGRLTNAEESAMFMAQTDPKQSMVWLTYLKTLNDVRKKRQLNLTKEIDSMYASWIDHPFIVIPGENFEKGILGPVAGRLAERYKKPVIVLSKNKAGDTYSGSGRSTGSVDLLGLLKDNTYVDKNRTGGHKAACGTSFPVGDLIPFWNELQKETQALPESDYVDISKDCFGYLELRDIDFELYSKIEAFQPFGQKFQKPTFQCEIYFKSIKFLGKDKIHQAVQIIDGIGTEFRGLYFFVTDEIKKKKKYLIEFTINQDDWKTDDKTKLVLHLKKIIKEIKVDE